MQRFVAFSVMYDQVFASIIQHTANHLCAGLCARACTTHVSAWLTSGTDLRPTPCSGPDVQYQISLTGHPWTPSSSEITATLYGLCCLMKRGDRGGQTKGPTGGYCDTLRCHGMLELWQRHRQPTGQLGSNSHFPKPKASAKYQ